MHIFTDSGEKQRRQIVSTVIFTTVCRAIWCEDPWLRFCFCHFECKKKKKKKGPYYTCFMLFRAPISKKLQQVHLGADVQLSMFIFPCMGSGQEGGCTTEKPHPALLALTHSPHISKLQLPGNRDICSAASSGLNSLLNEMLNITYAYLTGINI